MSAAKKNGAEPHMEASVEMVTPAMAMAWLAGAAKNRNISNDAVRRYGADMETGRWKLNGQGVIFDSNGQLVDGRHRLTAIVATGCTIQMLVIRGAKPDAFETMDAGRGRTLANTLTIDGHKNTAATSAVARMVWAYAAGTNLKYGSTRPELLSLIRRHPLIEDYTTQIINKGHLANAMGLPKSAFAAMLVLANEDRQRDVEVTGFVEGVVTGEGLFGGDPRLTLRRWLTQQRQEVGVGGSRIAEPFFAATSRAWSAFAEKRELSHMRLPMFFNRETVNIVGFDPKLWGDVPDMGRFTFARLGPELLDPKKAEDDPPPARP